MPSLLHSPRPSILKVLELTGDAIIHTTFDDPMSKPTNKSFDLSAILFIPGILNSVFRRNGLFFRCRLQHCNPFFIARI